MSKLIKFFIFVFVNSFNNYVDAFNLCIVGGSSGLGRELIFQGLSKNLDILALSNDNKDIYIPYRNGGLKDKTKKTNNNVIINANLKCDVYGNVKKYNYTNLIFTTSGTSFTKDYSDKLTKFFLKDISKECRQIILISAYGVGDSFKNLDVGYNIMNNWYLKDVYRAKNEQEYIINNLPKDLNIKTTIIRPKVLSYGKNIYNAKSRQKLANEILNNI